MHDDTLGAFAALCLVFDPEYFEPSSRHYLAALNTLRETLCAGDAPEWLRALASATLERQAKRIGGKEKLLQLLAIL